MSKMRRLIFTAAVLALPLTAPVAFAASTLDDLLESVREVRAQENQAYKERTAAFDAAPPNQQEQMLAEAVAKRDALAATSDTLSEQFSANELKINELKKALREKASALGLTEIFGLSKQVAGDSATALRQSLISTQFPAKAGEQDRDDFLREYAASNETPTAAELERVWFEIQREMTASGAVAKYTTTPRSKHAMTTPMPLIDSAVVATKRHSISIGPDTALDAPAPASSDAVIAMAPPMDSALPISIPAVRAASPLMFVL